MNQKTRRPTAQVGRANVIRDERDFVNRCCGSFLKDLKAEQFIWVWIIYANLSVGRYRYRNIRRLRSGFRQQLQILGMVYWYFSNRQLGYGEVILKIIGCTINFKIPDINIAGFEFTLRSDCEISSRLFTLTVGKLHYTTAERFQRNIHRSFVHLRWWIITAASVRNSQNFRYCYNFQSL